VLSIATDFRQTAGLRLSWSTNKGVNVSQLLGGMNRVTLGVLTIVSAIAVGGFSIGGSSGGVLVRSKHLTR